MSETILYQDTVTKNDDLGYYEVTRVHSDGRVASGKCGFHETRNPVKTLDMMLSRHLAGTGKRREPVGDVSVYIPKPKRTRVMRKAARKSSRKVTKRKTTKRKR